MARANMRRGSTCAMHSKRVSGENIRLRAWEVIKQEQVAPS
jgi:hypothetical protein